MQNWSKTCKTGAVVKTGAKDKQNTCAVVRTGAKRAVVETGAKDLQNMGSCKNWSKTCKLWSGAAEAEQIIKMV